MSLCSEFRVVMIATNSTLKRCSVRLYFGCLSEGSCLIYVIFVCLRIVVSNTYCVVLLFCLSFSYGPYIYERMLPVSLDCPFLNGHSVFSNVYQQIKKIYLYHFLLVRNQAIWAFFLIF